MAGAVRYLRGFLGAALAVGLGAVPALAIDPERRLDQLVHKVWTTEEGLPQNTVTDVLQAQDGYLWIATFGGLARFDGLHFTVFDAASSPGLLSNRLTALAEEVDEEGNSVLWLGTEEGDVCSLRAGEISCLERSEDLPRDSVWNLLPMPNGDLWARTGWDAIHWGQRGRGQGQRVTVNGRAGAVRFLVRDAEGHLWAGLRYGLARWEGDRFVRQGFSAELGSDELNHGIADPAGGLLLVTDDRLWSFRDGELTLLSELNEADVPVRQILRDRDGGLWFAGQGVGRLRAGAYDVGGEIVLREEARSFPIRVLYEDREGNLWIGSTGRGLRMLRSGSFESYVNPSRSSMGAVIETASGEILGGVVCGGTWRIEPAGMEPFDAPGSACVNTMLEDQSQRLWVGSEVLARRQNEEWTVFGVSDDAFASEPVLALYEGDEGRIWVGSRQGLSRFENGRFTLFLERDGLVNEDVRFITEDRQGNLWVAGPAGLIRFAAGEVTPETAQIFTTEDGLPHNYVRAVYEDGNGGLWIGTYGGGMAWMKGNTFLPLNRSHGLPENAVSSITSDGLGNLWLSGNRGVTRLSLVEADAFVHGQADRVHAVLYNADDGIFPSETNGGIQPAAWKARDGRIWFPTIHGVTVVDPERLVRTPPPPVTIERILSGGRERNPSGTALSRIEIEPVSRDLEVRYTGLQLGQPREVRFRYRLIGHDAEWIEAGSRRSAFYTDLSPGNYAFEVTAASGTAGEWNEDSAKVELIFRPYFYETTLFRVALSFFVLATLALGFHLLGLIRRREDLTRYTQELENKNTEMERFVHTVSHDLRSPLMTVRGFAGFLLQDAQAGKMKRVEQDVEQINQAVDRMSELLEDLLELSRVGRGMKTPHETALVDIVHTARGMVAARLNGVEVEVAEDLPTVVVDAGRFTAVFQNLLENAARFMGDQPQPRIFVGYRKEAGETIVFVQDNGVGIAPEHQERVFNLFERLDANVDGTGIGLAIVKRVVEVHGGRIWVESEGIGRGAVFCMTVPVRH